MVSTRRKREASDSPEGESSSTMSRSEWAGEADGNEEDSPIIHNQPTVPATTMTKTSARPTKKARKGSKPKSFMDLPRELRDQIYREILTHPGPVEIQQPKFHLAVRAVPAMSVAILRTTKKIYEEALSIMFSENYFVLDLNMITAIDWLGSLPTARLSNFVTEIGLSKAIMTGYLRLELGLFDSSKLRQDFIRKLVYELNIKTINIEVPDQYKPDPRAAAAAAANPGGNPLLAFRSRSDYSWSFTKELLDVLLDRGFTTLRLNYASPHPSKDPHDLVKLYALARVLYKDDEFDVETAVKRTEMAREAGRRPEFADRAAVERYVRYNRRMRDVAAKYDTTQRPWEKNGTAVIVRAWDDVVGGERNSEGLFEMRRLVKEASENLPREGWFD
ncbi:hypothetical protein EG328_001661 [Venturia inaequalis]|uniref:Uncharacterized protein n=1 Tax=Venturia inaequalis TaxID=5025 RepID=A0A8H3V0J3_VENIN|nr:hypothetical protein EG328_001661 [Venturia inaequalis]RDI85983.1 hypothetical protein Vi05172_g4046 [Venturia inaequalis]